MKKYDLLTLNIKKDAPSYMNEMGNFWLLEEDGDYQIFKFKRTITTIFGKKGEEIFVLAKNGKPFKDSQSFEQLVIFKDAHKIMAGHNCQVY